MDSTICAVSTAVGTGAISIIRCSGPEAIAVVNACFKGKNLKQVHSHTINYGFIMDEDEVIDEVLVNVMKAPKTFTTEDIVEINSHGGIAPTNRILELLLTKGCKLAEPGEFTKRAFLNGRIDLIEAEAVGDLIVSETEKARKLALTQVTGGLSNKIKQIRGLVLSTQAEIEVNIDYPEYHDIETITSENLVPKLNEIRKELEQLLNEAENGRLIKTGINAVILGQPNVGKSSILNAFLNEEKAIVTDIPGTTRDVVEGKININGFLLNILDTAGLRETSDLVEKIGVQKSLTFSESADLIIYVVDNTAIDFSTDLEFLQNQLNKKILIFINKDDKNPNSNIKLEQIFKNYNLVKGNTINETGLTALKAKIIDLFNLQYIETKNYSYLSNSRQIVLVKAALACIIASLFNLENNMPIDMITIDLKNCYEHLGEIIGETYKEDLLDELFSRFCLGK